MKRPTRVAHAGIALGLALFFAAIVASSASAAIVRSGTGCLRLATGTLSKIKEGDSPLGPCASGEVAVRLSGGDITAVATSASGGLQGGTDNGDASLGLQPSFRLPQDCAAGQVAKWDGASWVCAPGGGGGLTRLEDLEGLQCSTGADAGTVSLAINPASGVVSLSCPRLGQFQLTVATIGAGTITSVPPGINCGNGLGECSQSYPNAEIVTLTETHAANQVSFLGWGGACTGSGSAPTCQVAMDQARLATAIFQPVLTVNLVTIASSREFNCTFGICVYVDSFSESRARVTVFDSDTSTTLGSCDADTTVRNVVSQFVPPSSALTTCNIPVPLGHRVELHADDMTLLGGTQTFAIWQDGPCADSFDPDCGPSAPIVVHEQTTAHYR
jgi:hypothetical protein